MKKLLCILSATTLLIAVGCNKSEKKDTSSQQEEVRGDTIEREETINYETEDNMGRPVDEVEVEEVERKIED